MSSDVTMKMTGDNSLSLETRRPWVWPAVLLCGVFWLLYYGAAQLSWDLGTLFFFRLGICGVLLLSGIAFWWTNTRIPLVDRALIAVLFVVALVVTSVLSDKSIGGFGMYLFGIPVVYSVGALALLGAQSADRHTRRNAVALALVATFAVFLAIRMDGVDGNAGSAYSLRWSQTAEEKFLADRQATPTAPLDKEDAVRPLTMQPGDWPEFRGPARDGVTQSGEIRTDWSTPPPLLWKKLVGPAWSSVIVVDGKLFTQEQRGKVEAVVCYDAQTGAELWAAEYGDRYWDSVSGAGPRATPTFASGRIYAFGAQGELLAVDAANGKIAWTKKARDESKAEVQMWGFSSSPLVTSGVVIVFAGGEKGKSLLAYKEEDGKLAWTANAGKGTYCSPEVVTLGNQKIVIATSDLGLLGFDPMTGERLFKAGSEMPNHPHALQPHALPSADQSATHFLVASSTGVSEMKVTDAEKFLFEEGWTSKQLKPDFNDFVVFEGHAYGFDREIFACIRLSDGKGTWKKGRYGKGQVVLLADIAKLIVVSETGDVILLAANPDKHEELGRFQAIQGKTWNHAVVVGGRLYLRNAEEMACYDLRQ